MNLRYLSRAPSHCSALCISTFNRFQNFSSLPHTTENVIKKFCGRRGKSLDLRGCVYVINHEVADSIASCIAKEWNRGYLLEANPGPGVLSRSILQTGMQHLRVFEENEEFFPALEVLSRDYPSLEIVRQDLMMIPSVEYKKKFDSCDQTSYVKDYFDSIFKHVPMNSWENDTSFQIVSVIASKRSNKFLRYLLAALPNQDTLFSYGRCDFFLLINETEFMCMNALPKENFSMYRWSTVLYNIFFEMKCLQKFSSDSENFIFCNAGRDKKKKRTPYFYLIKLTPKRDIFTHTMTPDRLQEFFFFVRSNLAKRSDLVIKSMEKWMPFCGPRLIREGWNVFMRFGDLSPTEILRLFNSVASWSEYKDCYSEALACKFNRKNYLEEDSANE